MYRRGFTLIELLVVTVVLVLLVLVMFPVFARREGSKRIACPSNLKQLATAAAMYATDYDNRYPQAGLRCLDPSQPDGSAGCAGGALVRNRYSGEGRVRTGRFGYTETWQGGGLVLLYPYTKNWSVTWCPDIGENTPRPTDPKSYYSGFEWLKSPGRVRFPASKVLMIEAYSYHEEDKQKVRRLDDPPNPARKFYVAFVDGHVKAMDLSTGCSGSANRWCEGWSSCSGYGANGNYICSGAGGGVYVPDFPLDAGNGPIDRIYLPTR